MKRRHFLYNVVSEKVLGYFTDEEFTNHMRKIAVENGDEELSITVFGEAKDYLGEYCENLERYETELMREDILQVCDSINFEISDEIQYYVISNYNPQDDELWFETVEQLLYSFDTPYGSIKQLKIGRQISHKFNNGLISIDVVRLMEDKWELNNTSNGWFISIVDGNTLKQLLDGTKSLTDLVWY